MTIFVNDIANEIFIELNSPQDVTSSAIAYWLKTHIGDLNILINKNYTVNQNTSEISSSNPNEKFGFLEKSIFKMVYMIHYYERLFRNALGAASVDSVVSVTDDGSTVVKINKNEIAKNYAQLRKQINEELLTLTKNYNLNETKPIQVAGDDIIQGSYSSRGYGSSTRTIEESY
jgi:homoserine dehydrogenase